MPKAVAPRPAASRTGSPPQTPTAQEPPDERPAMSARASHPEGDLTVTVVLPSGGARTAEVPADVVVRDLLAELTSLLKLPTLGPDGRPMTYRIHSKALAP